VLGGGDVLLADARIAGVAIGPHGPAERHHARRQPGAAVHAQRGVVHAVDAGPVAKDHRVGIALAQGHTDQVAARQLTRALGHLLEDGVEIDRHADVGGHTLEHRDLVPATLLGAPPRLFLVLASGFFRLPALGGEALEGFDAQP